MSGVGGGSRRARTVVAAAVLLGLAVTACGPIEEAGAPPRAPVPAGVPAAAGPPAGTAPVGQFGTAPAPGGPAAPAPGGPAAPGAPAPGGRPAPGAPSPADLPAQLLEALQRDLGLDVQQAVARLAEEGSAGRIEEQLRALLGPAFGGAWFDAAAGALRVATTDPALAGAIEAAGAVPEVRAVAEAALQAVQAELDAAGESAPDAVTGWHVDPASGTVTVTATDAAAAEEFIARAGGTGDPVRVELTDSGSQTMADLVGGMGIQSGSRGCSLGFTARSETTTYAITAGHCAKGTTRWGADGQLIGTTLGGRFPGRDYGVVEVTNPAWTATSRIVSTESVLGVEEAAVGASTCRDGARTGYQCGTILAKDQTVNFPQGVVYGLTTTSACAAAGDSGGPFVSGRQAQGLLSGGGGSCGGRAWTHFQPIDEVLGLYGLTLVTG